MKRAVIAVVAVGLVVAAVSIARASSSDDDSPSAKPSASTLDRDVVGDQTRLQAEQLRKAQADLRERTDALADDMRSRPLVITIRDERPGAVWVHGRVDGVPACVAAPEKASTRLNVAGNEGQLQTVLVPAKAQRLTTGACEAVITLYLARQDWYEISVAGAGHDTFDPVTVEFSDDPQKVLITG